MKIRRGLSVGMGLALMHCAMAAQTPAEVRMRRTGAGQYLTDTRGMTLYTYAADTVAGKSACVAECARNWPPLRVAATAVEQDDWTVIPRDDGAAQWAWRGRPLYRYAKDSYAGSMFGHGVGNVWQVALREIDVPPGFAVRLIYLGRILTTAQGRTLYWTKNEQRAVEAPLPAEWRPVYAPWMAQPRGEWTLSALQDGQRQWTFLGHRLFTHSEDLKPGDTAGLAQPGDWEAAVLDPAPPGPSWVTVQSSDMGEVFADARGHTLYVLVGQLDRIRQLTCDDACIRRNFRTVAVAAPMRPTGDWAAVASPLGEPGLVWAYRGNAVFTHRRDKEPGAIGGDKWASGGGNGAAGWTPMVRRRDLDE